MNGNEIQRQTFLNNSNVSDVLKQVLNGQLSNVNNTLTPEDQLRLYKAVADDKTGAGQYIRSVFNQNDAVQQSAYETMRNTLGRDPTTSEYTQLIPDFGGPNGLTNGRAGVSKYFDTLQKDPTNVNSPLNPANSAYQKTLSPYNDSVNQQFQSTLGRAATQDELSHFSGLLASGQTDAYGLGSFLKTMPEYTNAQDAQFRSGLNDTLTNYDTTEFNREKGGVMADYAARGMQPGNSPSLDYALTDLMGKIATNRSAYLANLSASQYGGNKDLAAGNYENSLNQMYQQNQQTRQNNMDMSNYYMQRGNQGADYYTQMNDYMNFMNKNRSRGANPMYGAIGGLAGAGIGAMLGPAGSTAGASLGYQMGQGAGNAFGYQNY